MWLGTQVPTISSVPEPLPTGWSKRVSAATSFYAAFRPLFRQIGRWCTGIRFDTYGSFPQNVTAKSLRTLVATSLPCFFEHFLVPVS